MKMSLQAPIRVRSFKIGRVTVQSLVSDDVVTADFVSATPKILRAVDGVFKSAFVGRQGVDLRDINRARQGLKEPEPEITSAICSDATR